MPRFDLDELFSKPDAGAALHYLWGRLQDRDLSGEEALALLSAVHRELAQAPAPDPKVYAEYSRFMESLSKDMPVVHDYVVARWIESRRGGRREPRPALRTAGGEDAVSDDPDPAPQEAAPNSAVPAGFHAIPAGAAERGQGGEEPGEPEEDDDHGDGAPGGKPEEPGERDLKADETEEVEEQEPEGKDEERGGEAEPEEAEQGEAAEAADEPAESHGEEPQGGEPEADEQAGEAESEPAEAADESAEEPASEGPHAEGGQAAAEEDGEWPEIEEPEAPEPNEPFEGGEA